MTRLFEPLQLGGLRLANRIVVAPMCQYSADEGSAGDWHLIHLGHLALSGAGLLVLEATAVSPVGRISPDDLGLYSDANEAALARVVAAAQRHAPIPIAIQLSHAGRKASSHTPWARRTGIGGCDSWSFICVHGCQTCRRSRAASEELVTVLMRAFWHHAGPSCMRRSILMRLPGCCSRCARCCRRTSTSAPPKRCRR